MQIFYRLQDAFDGGAGGFVPIETCLGYVAGREVDGGPDISGIHLFIGLQYGYAPLRFPFEYGPVQGRGPPITFDTRVHNKTDMVSPDLLRDGPLEEWRNNQVRLCQFH